MNNSTIRNSKLKLRRFLHPWFISNQEEFQCAISHILELTTKSRNPKLSYQNEIDESYKVIFGDHYNQAFQEIFCQRYDRIKHTSTITTIFTQYPLFIDGLRGDDSIQNSRNKSQKKSPYRLESIYSPGGESKGFSYGFIVFGPKGSIIDYIKKLLGGGKPGAHIDIPIIKCYHKPTMQFLQSPQGKKIFSILHTIWSLGNHDNTVHNRFFLGRSPEFNNVCEFNKTLKGVVKNHPSYVGENTNILEVWSIHAHRDLMYCLYNRIPELYTYIINLGIRLIQELERHSLHLKKAENNYVEDVILNLFCYPFCRIIDIGGADFVAPQPNLSKEDFLKQGQRSTLMQKLICTHAYDQQKYTLNWIHNSKNPKFIEPYTGIEYYDHKTVLRDFDRV